LFSEILRYAASHGHVEVLKYLVDHVLTNRKVPVRDELDPSIGENEAMSWAARREKIFLLSF
jgi:hypothetical protein